MPAEIPAELEPQALAVVIQREEEDSLPKGGIIWQSLSHDVNSKPLPFALSWALLWRKRDLLFSVRWPLEVLGIEAEKGSFVEGLWQGNCAEFFLSHPQGHEYWEFNLSPQGAWWWSAFTEPRVRREPEAQALPGVRASWYETADFQVSVLSIPRLHLERWLEATPANSSLQLGWRGNVCACIGEPQQFASVANFKSQYPDFHLPEQFLPLQMG